MANLARHRNQLSVLTKLPADCTIPIFCLVKYLLLLKDKLYLKAHQTKCLEVNGFVDYRH